MPRMKPAEKKARPITSALAPDLEAVAQFIREMIAKGAVVALIEAVVGLLARMRDINTELMGRIAQHRRARPPSERMSILQCELPFMKAVNDGATTPAPKPEKTRRKRGPSPDRKHPHGRAKLPAWMERVPDRKLVPEADRTCPHCGTAMKTLDFKRSEKLDVIPARFVAAVTERETVSCPCCHECVRTAERADEVLDRGVLGNELLVQSLVDHYDNAVPFERMEREARAQDVPLSANTLASSVGRVIDLMDPIVRHISERAMRAGYVSLDATSIRVLDDKHPLGIRTGSLWGIVGDHRYAAFFCEKSGHAKLLEKRIEQYTFVLAMCDGSATLNVVEKPGTVRGGCWAHARRRLVAALRANDERSIEPLGIIAKIFHVDAESKRRGEDLATRLIVRQRESAPLMRRLQAWCEAHRGRVEPKTLLGNAVTYMTNQWTRLSRFLEYEAMELTNNEIEADLRRHVLNRKTWFFVGHDDSARRTADALTLLTTCRKMGVEPRGYLRATLRSILAGEKDLAVLLPENYAARVAQEKAARSDRERAAAKAA